MGVHAPRPHARTRDCREWRELAWKHGKVIAYLVRPGI